MKKFVYFSAIVAVGLSSCAQNEIESVPALDQDNAIGFSAYSGLTRGQEMDIDMLKENGFGLFGYYHKYREGNGYEVAGWENEDEHWSGADYMNNQMLTYDANALGTIGNWVYSPIKYWPNNVRDRISFIGYAPYVDLTKVDPEQSYGIMAIDAATDCNAIYPTSKAPSIDFRLHTSPSELIDLVGASSFDQGKIVDGGINGYENVVNLQFEHLLTKVNLYAKLDGQIISDMDNESSEANTTEVVVTKLMLVGPNNRTLLNKNGYPEKGTGLYTEGRFNYYGQAEYAETGVIGGWENLSNEGFDEYYDLDKEEFLNFGVVNTTNYSKRGVMVKIDKNHSTPLFADGEALYLLPPSNAEGLQKDQAVKLYVEYDVITTDLSLPNGGRHIATNRDIVDFNRGSLKMGTAYNVQIKIDLKSVNVNADVCDWANGGWFDIFTPNDSKDAK